MKRRTCLYGFGLSAVVAMPMISSASLPFLDTYSTDTTANYTQGDQGGSSSTWSVSGGVLHYTRTSGTSYTTNDLLLNSSVANTAGLSQFTVGGDINNPGGGSRQPGLILTGDNTNGGFVIQTDDAGGQVQNQFVLLRLDGSHILNDEGGNGSPIPVLATLGNYTTGGFSTSDNYRITALVDRSGAHPTFSISIQDLTAAGQPYLTQNQAVTDPSDPASFGGTQIGWRTRANIGGVPTTPDFSFDNLTLSATPEPGSLGLLGLAGAGLIARRRRTR